MKELIKLIMEREGKKSQASIGDVSISDLTLEQEYFLIRDHNKKLCNENEILKCRLKNEVAMIEDAANEQINELAKKLETTKKLLDEARSMLTSASEICKREGYIQFMIEINQFLNKLKNERGER